MKCAGSILLAIAALPGCHRDHATKQQAAAVNASPLASPADLPVAPDAAPSFAETFHHAGCKPTSPEPATPQSSALASGPTSMTLAAAAAAADGCTAPAPAPPAPASSPLPPR